VLSGFKKVFLRFVVVNSNILQSPNRYIFSGTLNSSDVVKGWVVVLLDMKDGERQGY
jgi:hypothetical protein